MLRHLVGAEPQYGERQVWLLLHLFSELVDKLVDAELAGSDETDNMLVGPDENVVVLDLLGVLDRRLPLHRCQQRLRKPLLAAPRVGVLFAVKFKLLEHVVSEHMQLRI